MAHTSSSSNVARFSEAAVQSVHLQVYNRRPRFRHREALGSADGGRKIAGIATTARILHRNAVRANFGVAGDGHPGVEAADLRVPARVDLDRPLLPLQPVRVDDQRDGGAQAAGQHQVGTLGLLEVPCGQKKKAKIPYSTTHICAVLRRRMPLPAAW